MSTPEVRRAEDGIFSRVMNMFRNWLPRVADAVLVRSRNQQMMPEATAVFSTVDTWREQVRMLQDDLEPVARIGWSQVTGEITFSGSNIFILRALEATGNLLSDMPNEVHSLIIDEIAAGLSAGEDTAAITRRIELLLSVTGNDRWANRARTIAITETTRAANAGALAAATTAEPTVGPMLKRWNDEDDEDVRLTHRIADGSEVRLTQPFDVGGFPMMFPGDPIGPPHEVVNCRCDLSFRRAS